MWHLGGRRGTSTIRAVILHFHPGSISQLFSRQQVPHLRTDLIDNPGLLVQCSQCKVNCVKCWATPFPSWSSSFSLWGRGSWSINLPGLEGWLEQKPWLLCPAAAPLPCRLSQQPWNGISLLNAGVTITCSWNTAWDFRSILSNTRAASERFSGR